MDAPTPTGGTISRILEDADGLSRGEVLARLTPVVYDELRHLAAAQLRGERGDHTLQPTALVSELYVRLLGDDRARWNDTRHFFRAAARAMRLILIDHARRRGSLKRGGDRRQVTLNDVAAPSWDQPEAVLALDEALLRLEEQDPRAAEVVQLRYFTGMSVAQAAEVLGVSERTVKREWTFARAWLRKSLS